MENNIDINKLNNELSQLQRVLDQKVPAGLDKEQRARSQAILKEEKAKARARIREINKAIAENDEKSMFEYDSDYENYKSLPALGKKVTKAFYDLKSKGIVNKMPSANKIKSLIKEAKKAEKEGQAFTQNSPIYLPGYSDKYAIFDYQDSLLESLVYAASGAFNGKLIYDANDEKGNAVAEVYKGFGQEPEGIDSPELFKAFNSLYTEEGNPERDKQLLSTIKENMSEEDWTSWSKNTGFNEGEDIDSFINRVNDYEETDTPDVKSEAEAVDPKDIDVEETVKNMTGNVDTDKPVLKSEKEEEVEEEKVDNKVDTHSVNGNHEFSNEEAETDATEVAEDNNNNNNDTLIQDSVTNILDNMHFNEDDVKEEVDIPEPDTLSKEEAEQIQAEADAEDEAFIKEAEAKEAAKKTKEEKLEKANKTLSKAEEDFNSMAGATPDPDPTDKDNISYGKDETTLNSGEHIPDNDDNLPALNTPAVRQPTELDSMPEKESNDIIDAEYTIEDAEEPVVKKEPKEEEEEEKAEKEKKEHHMPNLGLTEHSKGDDFEAHVDALKINPSETHSETVQVSDKNTKEAEKNNTNDMKYFDTPDKSLASDERLKKLFGDDDRVACIAKINSYDFKYKPEAQKALGVDDDLHTGVIAQELEINPAFKGVVTEEDGTKMLKIPELTASNTAALSDLARAIENISTRLEKMEKTLGDRK